MFYFNNDLSSLLLIGNTIKTNSDSCPANSSKEISYSIAKAGYKPLGVVGFTSGHVNLSIVAVNIQGVTVFMDVYNATPTPITFTARADVLYQKEV